MHAYPPEPYRFKVIEPLPRELDFRDRRRALEAAAGDVMRLRPDQVGLDLGSTRGGAAVTDRQWAELVRGDEAYAGSVDYYELEQTVLAVFGKGWVVPTHAGRGAENLLLQALVSPGRLVLTNGGSETLAGLAAEHGAREVDLSRGSADFDLNRLGACLGEGNVALVVAACAASPRGGQFLTLVNLREVCGLCRAAGVTLALDVSCAASAAYAQGVSVASLADLAGVLYMSAREDACCQTGGLLAGDDPELATALRNLVVVFEGLHTYGGQAGRDLRVFSQGLREMTDPATLEARRRQLVWMEDRLAAAGIPVVRPSGSDGVVVDAAALLGGSPEPARALAQSLYLEAGVRAAPAGNHLLLRIARRAFTEMQLSYALEALARVSLGSESHSSVRPEPYRPRVVEALPPTTREERQHALVRAGYNTFLLPSRLVTIDLLTDSGTTAMSTAQWSAMVSAAEDDAVAGLEAAIRDVFGYRFVLPTHQGRAAEHLLSRALIRPGQAVLNNLYFTTTREHQERAGGIFVDCIRDEAHDPLSDHPFKGDLDLAKVERAVDLWGSDGVAYICLETNVNMAGGQPLSLAGTRAVSALARRCGIPLYFDATRAAENAWFIHCREPGQQGRPVREILRELLSLGDGCTISGKKDLLVNIGGLLATNDAGLFERARALGRLFSGSPATGGLAPRDLAAMAVGAYEVTDEAYLRHRISQVHYLAWLLRDAGLPIVEPPGSHAVFLDARRFLPHLAQEQYPAQRLAAELYLEAGVRGMERGLVSAGRDPASGREHGSALELVRLTVPRRAYTHSHLEEVARACVAVWNRRHGIAGLRMVYEPPSLRFFQARFEPLDAPPGAPAARPLVVACSGACAAGRLAYDVGVELERRGAAELTCLARISAGKAAVEGERELWAVDGCVLQCSLAILRQRGREPQRHLRLHDAGVAPDERQLEPASVLARLGVEALA